MRYSFTAIVAMLIAAGCNRTDDTPTPGGTCPNNGPIVSDTGGSYLTLPDAFTPNGDGLNDAWVAFTDNIDTAGFSVRVLENGNVHFSTTDPYFQWLPGQYIGQRKEFQVEASFRVRSGAQIEACGRLVIPKQDSFFTCAEDIGGLRFGDQVNIATGAFQYATAEEECP